MDNLKKRQKDILQFMKDEIISKGYPPTVREICAALKIKSTSTVHKDLAILVEQGFVKKDPAKPRALCVVELEEEKERNKEKIAQLDSYKDAYDELDKYANISKSPVVEVPLIGHIAAGSPILAEENFEDSFPIPERFVGRNPTFMLTVHGESMIEAGIMDGDYILVEQQNTARNGDMVVALIEDFESEATVKTFYREDGHIRLQPENPDMSPIIVEDCKILGKVRGVFRYW